ncbi:hypothetical protein D9758_018660 [Tetrapyrgos nigripes]|uniref:ATP-dependent DNA helicase n=1 Tax=Tetrapyrgos nigripes TaxID=182062 RepID=A0A8H5EZ77_9AGAR|nr:hypothetical protein D9758_018660 [Tetrapyrgos nigripes]
MIDKDTGTLYMKKQDPWINTFTHELTYISRCNTDVTCLNSGTAIKAVVVYVSDYITKATLKTHVIFDAIVSILDGNKELVNGTQTGQEKARKLLTKIVNLLSTKMEMGSPMICMYLLGNPDHYTAHQFLPLYWQPFVSEVRQYFDESSTGGPSFDKVALIRKGGRVVGLSPVFDYIYRPGELKHISLYDWVRLTEKKTLKQLAKRSKSNKNQPMCEPEMSDDEDIDIEAVGRNVRLKSNCFKFHASHPLHATHGIRLRKHSDKLVVNFLGSSLPRRDKGDYQYYCTTMLTLFKPWRSGKDLLCECSDWSVAFNEHSFTDRQKELMENFNVIYECLDARDDYRAQMRAGGDMSNSWDHFADDTEDPLAEVHEQQTVFPTEDLLADIDLQDGSSEMGRLQRRRILNMESMKRVLHTSFWNLPTQVKLPDMSKFVAPEGNVSSVEWKKRVLKERQLVLDGKGQSCDKEKKDGDGGEPPKKKFTYDKVEVVDKSFLEKRFSTGNNKHLINGCVGEFSLNREQEKAFRIIVNHAVCSSPQQLQMYIAGMGGTGKSQVLKAVAKFFSARGESGRIIILAPTGNAAALLGGSTYHSVLGINERKSDGSLPQVRQRLLGVDYIFIDEVSMLSAQDLYRISVRLCKARDNLDTPFGGLNLIVAGDFAQLPPPMGGEYTALYSRNGDGLSNKEQEQSIGRSLWHGFTTVVILRQNMRQKEQTPADARFRTALENMRYKSCTMDDIAFLNTRLSSNISGMRSVCDSLFRDLPIITALNNHKDQINQTGTERFAIESGQKLLDFYSEDTILPVKEIQETEGGKTRKETNLLRIKGMTDSLQRILWGQTPSTSDSMVAPKLSLCYGMPIMIRTNLATEICITKGQEGTVYGWTSSVGSRKQRMLDTLFVKLTNPPNKVRIPGLPLNVVPITRSLVSTYCSLPDDRKVYISRSQVEVLPCFSMTDYASQGKTRPFNPVDIQNCRDFHGMYTALSRSATADGTIILQGFDPNKIRGGLGQTIGSRSLHKEYIALEFLDEITNRRYTGKLHKSVKGDHRSYQIRSFRATVGEDYKPPHLYRSLKWGRSSPFTCDYEISGWKILEKEKDKKKKDKPTDSKAKLSNLIVAQGTGTTVYNPATPETVAVSRKRKRSDVGQADGERHRKVSRKASRKVSGIAGTDDVRSTDRGPRWASNSCAYDSILTVLMRVWLSNPARWSGRFRDIENPELSNLVSDLELYALGSQTLEVVRENLRTRFDYMKDIEPSFALGRYVSVGDVLKVLMKHDHDLTQAAYTCTSLHPSQHGYVSDDVALLESVRPHPSIVSWMSDLTEIQAGRCDFPDCMERRMFTTRFVSVPKILCFYLGTYDNSPNMYVDATFNLSVNNVAYKYELAGVIYFGDQHFTARVVDPDLGCYYYDGMEHGGALRWNGNLKECTIHLNRCRGRKANSVFYVLA